MKVVLMCKLADCLDGIDVADHHVGDVLDLPWRDAQILLAEQWAIPDRRAGRGAPPPLERRRATNAPTREFTENALERAS
jgi:hypothetical protein